MTRHTIDRPTISPEPRPRPLLARISRLEWTVAAVIALVLAGLAVAEPDILEAPFENTRTVGFTVGGTVAAAVALVAMLRLRVPSPIRVVVLSVPFVAVSWWLISPFFIDDVVHDDFATSIADAAAPPGPPADAAGSVPGTADPNSSSQSTSDEGTSTGAAESAPQDAVESTTPATGPAGPVLLGAGQFAGLAGHEGTGDAGIFRLDDGSHVLRLENFDIQNGPDLRLYLVPGAGQSAPAEGSLDLGALRGNVGDQTYDLAADFVPTAGDWTVLVWCEAFSVEFVGATLTVR